MFTFQMQLLVYLYATIYMSAVTVRCSQFVLPATNGCGQSKMSIQAADECLSVMPIPRYNTTPGSIIRYRCSSRTDTSPEATIDYCPVQICQDNMTWSIPSLSCAKSECVGPANYYAGQRICTTSGIACQRWSSQNPHKHNFTNGAMFPEKSVTAAAAYCRDPSNIHGNPWCFTQDSNITWEYCDIPKCADLPLVQNSCSKTDNKAVKKVDCGMPDFEIKADNACVDLAPLKPFNTTEGSHVVYSCASLQLNVQSVNGYCPVEFCQKNGKWSIPYLSCAETECFIKGKSQYYRGKRTCTSKGVHCATWQYREVQTFNNSSFPEGTVAAKSFCRDPDGQKGSPWCFIGGLANTWDYCHIPSCSDIPIEEASCAGNGDITTVKVDGNVLVTTDVDGQSTTMVGTSNQYAYYSASAPMSAKPVEIENEKFFASTKLSGISEYLDVTDFKKNSVVTETPFKTEMDNNIYVTHVSIVKESIASTVMETLTRTRQSDPTLDYHVTNDDENTNTYIVTDMSTKIRTGTGVSADNTNTKNLFSAGSLTANNIVTGVTIDQSTVAPITEGTGSFTVNTIVTDVPIDESTVAVKTEKTRSLTENTIVTDVLIDESTVAVKTETTRSLAENTIVTDVSIDKTTIAMIMEGTGSLKVNTITNDAPIDKSTVHTKAEGIGSLTARTMVADVLIDTTAIKAESTVVTDVSIRKGNVDTTTELGHNVPNVSVTDVLASNLDTGHKSNTHTASEFLENAFVTEATTIEKGTKSNLYTDTLQGTGLLAKIDKVMPTDKTKKIVSADILTDTDVSVNNIVTTLNYKKHFVGNTMPQEEGVSDNNIITQEDKDVPTKTEVTGDPFVKEFTTMNGDVTYTSPNTRISADKIVPFIPDFREDINTTTVEIVPSDNTKEYEKPIGVMDTSPTTGLSALAEVTSNTVGIKTAISKIKTATDVTNINRHVNTNYFTQPTDFYSENNHQHASIPNVVKHTIVSKQAQHTAVPNVLENVVISKETENNDIAKDTEQKLIFVVTETFEKPRNAGSDTTIVKEQNKKHIAKNSYTIKYPTHDIVSTVVQHAMRHTENNINMDIIQTKLPTETNYDSHILPERDRMHKPSTKSATANIDKNRQTSVESDKKYHERQEHFRETASESTPNGFGVPIPKQSLNQQNQIFDGLYPKLLHYKLSIPTHVSFILIHGHEHEFRVVQYSSSKWNIIECARECEYNENCALFKHRDGECVTFSFNSTVRHHIYCEKHEPCYFKMTSGFTQ